MREDGKDKNSVVSFALTDEPRHIDLIASKNREEVRATRHCIQFCTQLLANMSALEQNKTLDFVVL